MIFSKRFINILLRVLVIVGLAVGLAYSLLRTDLFITPVMFAILILLAAMELTWHLQQQERNWAGFLLSVKYHDFNRVYQKQTTSPELREAYGLITESMESLQSGKEAEFQLLETVLSHVSIAVGCYTEEGDVLFTNKAFDQLLALPGLIHIDRLQKEFPKIHQVMVTKEAAPSEWIDHTNGQQLFVKREAFKLKGKGHKLISLTDIRTSLDAKEIESYQKLMQVMTHEIMNSATPILSLIKVVNQKLIKGSELIVLDTKDQRNVSISLYAIEERTSGILKFVEAYKQINRSIDLQLEQVPSSELLKAISSLMSSETTVKLILKDKVDNLITLDRNLITQVLINLVKNALDAVASTKNPIVLISIDREPEWISIAVADNGPGVAIQAINHIFIPFFTTKTTGSGIGLALSRKIVQAHGGHLVYHRRNEQTLFTMTIPTAKQDVL
ncbi:MAG: two-component system nitrogen regulation sensor histidine kinase NtrY [Cyclobacteriaceae bacterium]|jgi:two-component system nitrogen regulation sensor histidine kinase NtrY